MEIVVMAMASRGLPPSLQRGSSLSFLSFLSFSPDSKEQLPFCKCVRVPSISDLVLLLAAWIEWMDELFGGGKAVGVSQSVGYMCCRLYSGTAGWLIWGSSNVIVYITACPFWKQLVVNPPICE